MKRIVAILLVGMMAGGCGLKTDDATDKAAAVKKTQTIAPRNERMAAASPAPASQDPLITLAASFITKGDILSGIKVLDEAIRTNPRNIPAYVLLGQTYMHVNQLDRAVDTFNAAVTIDPSQGEIFYMLAIANGLRGRRDLAAQDAEKALLIFQKNQEEDGFRRALVLLQGLSEE